MHPLLASFVDLEDRSGAELLRDAVAQRRFGSRALEFNCFTVVIDADAGTVTLEDAMDLDHARAVLRADDVVRDIADLLA